MSDHQGAKYLCLHFTEISRNNSALITNQYHCHCTPENFIYRGLLLPLFYCPQTQDRSKTALNFPWEEIKIHKKSPKHLPPHSRNSLKIKRNVFPRVFPVHCLPHSGQYHTLTDQEADTVITQQSWHKGSSTARISYPARAVCPGHCSVWPWGQDGLRLPLPARSLPGSSAILLEVLPFCVRTL